MPLEKKTGFIIHGTTGCSCDSCKDEQFIDGIYETADVADIAALEFAIKGTIKSQYSNTGIYSIYRIEYEIIDEERIIIGNSVIEGGMYDSGVFSFREHGRACEFINYGSNGIASTGDYIRN